MTGIITDLMDGTKKIVGVVEIPKTLGKFYASLGFVEEYSQWNKQFSSGFVMGVQSSIFRTPIGDNTVKARHQILYGSCKDPYIVQAVYNMMFASTL
ncbi:hypothetical protein [Bartonella jaculi]|uniref:Uncharacterized protein n=1 Tax=Bartonella jaculi TaxID=686226 RepID=A0ABP9N9A4_9HYPH